MNSLSFGFGAVEAEFWRLLFVMTRIGAAMLAAPFFGSMGVPPQVRVVASGALAVLVCAWLPVNAPPSLFSLSAMIMVAGEVLIGLTLGFVLQLAFAAPVIAAEIIGGSMGMSLATSVDPTNGAHSPALGQYFMVVLTVIFFGLGAHLQWLALVVESYRSFPPGQAWLAMDRIHDVAGFAAQTFMTALAMALPVTLILLLVQVATGVLSRSAPALNLFALGLPAGVIAGLAALILAAPLIGDIMADLSRQAVTQAASVLTP